MNAEIVSECPICFENIGEKNYCKTDCGHIFCFKCILTAFKNNSSCPCCRSELIESVDEEDIEDSDDEDDEDSDDEYDDDDDEDDEDLIEGSVETITAAFVEKGYSMEDVVSILLSRYRSEENKNNVYYYNKIVKEFDDIVIDIDVNAKNEHYEREMMGNEDILMKDNNVVHFLQELMMSN